MDGGAPMSPEDVQGRNMWIVDGRQRPLLGHDPTTSLGTFELAQDDLVAPDDALQPRRRDRFFYSRSRQPTVASRSPLAPIRRASACGLTSAILACPPDPFADDKKYKGVQIGARGKTVPVGSLQYGEPTGARRPSSVSQSHCTRTRGRNDPNASI